MTLFLELWNEIFHTEGVSYFLRSFLSLVLVISPALMAEADQSAFKVQSVIHPVVQSLPAPTFWTEIGGVPQAVSTANQEAEFHVQHGMALFHAAWDFEAYRHFCAAAQKDPDCVLAYWGIVMSLSRPNHEFSQQRQQAMERMLDLVEAGKGSDLEQGYAFLAGLYVASPGQVREAVRLMNEKYPNDLQSQLLAAHALCDGYFPSGEMKYGQEKAYQRMLGLRKAYPNNISILAFSSLLFADLKVSDPRFRSDLQSTIGDLTKLAPSFPIFHYAKGHFHWKAGDQKLAEASLVRARDLFQKYMAEQQVSYHDSSGWVRTLIQLAVCYHEQGRDKEALALAEQLRQLTLDPERMRSSGANLILWEARTLKARLRLAMNDSNQLKKALDEFPEKKEVLQWKGKTLAVYYYEGLKQAVSAYDLIQQGSLTKAQSFQEALTHTIGLMSRDIHLLQITSEKNEWQRAFQALRVYEADLKGMLAWKGPKEQRKSALNWCLSAIDRHEWPSHLSPPPVLLDSKQRLRDYYLSIGQKEKASQVH